jgi:hypothetical protein
MKVNDRSSEVEIDRLKKEEKVDERKRKIWEVELDRLRQEKSK